MDIRHKGSNFYRISKHPLERSESGGDAEHKRRRPADRALARDAVKHGGERGARARGCRGECGLPACSAKRERKAAAAARGGMQRRAQAGQGGRPHGAAWPGRP